MFMLGKGPSCSPWQQQCYCLWHSGIAELKACGLWVLSGTGLALCCCWDAVSG